MYGYAALARTNDSFWDGNHSSMSSLMADVVFNFRCSVTSSISHIRDVALSKMSILDSLGIIDDNNNKQAQIRKEFLRSILSNNHEVETPFQEVFASLDNNVYKSFKEEVINTCLFSPSYNAKRDPYLKQQNDSALIDSLDRSIYSKLLRNI